MMKNVVITGGTGLIGEALTKALVAKGFNVIIFTRKARESHNPFITYVPWDPARGMIDKDAVAEAHYIIHLAGANVADGRWTARRKREIIDSRVQSGELLVETLRQVPNTVKAVISSSATGYYGPDPQLPNPKPFEETDGPDTDFLANVVQQWEAAILPVQELDKRVVVLRTGIVLSSEGGAFEAFSRPLRFGLATVLGPGSQQISWIHIDDLVRIYIDAINHDSMSGVYNAVAPQPASNRELILEMARQGKYLLAVRVPSFALKIALGEMSVEVLKSTTVSSAKIEREGFVFQFPDMPSAVRDLWQ